MIEKFIRLVFGIEITGYLTARVQENIARQQQESELLISWVELAFVAFFSTLYALSQKTSDIKVFEPFPWAISLYLLFTLTRLTAT